MLGPSSRNSETVKPEALAGVPWNTRDLVFAAFFFVFSVLSVLASVQAAGALGSDQPGEEVAAGFMAVLLGLAIAAGLARLGGAPFRMAILLLLVTSGGAALFGFYSESSLTDSGYGSGGVPATVVFIALVETLLLISTLLFTRLKYGVPWGVLGVVWPGGLRPFGVALVYWLLALVAIGIWVVLIQLTGADDFLFPDNASDALEMTGGSVALAILLVGIWGPIGEEFFFRGFLLTGLRNRFGVKTAVLISSVLFGLVHIAPGAIVPTFFLGVAFAVIYIRTRSLLPAIFAHCLQNIIAVSSVGFST